MYVYDDNDVEIAEKIIELFEDYYAHSIEVDGDDYEYLQDEILEILNSWGGNKWIIHFKTYLKG